MRHLRGGAAKTQAACYVTPLQAGIAAVTIRQQ